MKILSTLVGLLILVALSMGLLAPGIPTGSEPGLGTVVSISLQPLALPLAAVLGLSILLTRIVDRREPRAVLEPEPGPEASAPTKEPDTGPSALSVVFSSRFLLAVAAITLLLNWVNTNGENLLFRVVQQYLGDRASDQGIEGHDAIIEAKRDETAAGLRVQGEGRIEQVGRVPAYVGDGDVDTPAIGGLTPLDAA